MLPRCLAALFFTFLLLTLPAHSAESAPGDPEIRYLLTYVEQSQVRFIRGGKEYSAQEAADHLRMKLSKAGGRVKTAEDFIQGIATKSYLTGQPYRVKLADGRERPTGAWLSEILTRHRQRAKK